MKYVIAALILGIIGTPILMAACTAYALAEGIYKTYHGYM